MQASQNVPVRVTSAVQIWTPGLPLLCVQRRTSCSRHGQVEPMASFQAHSLGVVFKHVELVYCPHTGTAA